MIVHAVRDYDGIVHSVHWMSRDSGDFTLSCEAKIYAVGSPYFVPTRKKVSCLKCLAES